MNKNFVISSMNLLKNNRYLLLFIILCFIIFSPFFLQGKIPIPADDLVGLYHPWRDAWRKDYPNGIPFKNPLITDPIRQQYPYRILAIEQMKQGKFPGWNPYSFSGTPLFANIQTAAFYPFNILFWIFNDITAWSLLIFLQPLLAGVFLYFYLQSIKLEKQAAFLGGASFAFSGFMTSWLTWNTIGHVALWLPLILLAKDKLLQNFNLKWALILIFSESAMILAGHIQTALYIIFFTSIFLFFRAYSYSNRDIKKTVARLLPFLITGFCFVVITSIQWYSTLHLILQSAREFDLTSWLREDWFIPWKHFVQFLAPDFFGNPATNNYWGVWNYGEFVGYVGVITLFFALLAIFFRRDKKTLFYVSSLIVSLLLAFPTIFAKLPYQLNIPFLSTLQPSRIMILIDFCLAVLGALGIDYFLKIFPKNIYKIWFSKMMTVFVIMAGIFASLWFVILVFGNQNNELQANLSIAKRNLILPTLLMITLISYALILRKFKRKHHLEFITLMLFVIAFADQLRFVHKFTPFISKDYIFPKTETISFLQENLGHYRYMTTDRRIMPPNVSTFYKLATTDGYDPLYLKSYGEFVAGWVRNEADITPASFNRILVPEKYNSFFTGLLNVKYILSLVPINDPQLKLVFIEGETHVYENIAVLPKVLLLEKLVRVDSPEQVIQSLFEYKNNLKTQGFTQDNIFIDSGPLGSKETAELTQYSLSLVKIDVNVLQQRVLVITDPMYTNWNVFIDGKPVENIRVNHLFRGVIVPAGRHIVEYRFVPLSFRQF